MKQPTSSRTRYQRFRRAFREGRAKELSDYPREKLDERVGGASERREYLRQYIAWIMRHWWPVLTLTLLSLVGAGLEMVQPLFLRYIMDRVLLAEGTITTSQKLRMLHGAGAAFLAVVVVNQLLNLWKNYRQRQLNVRVILALRRALFERLLNLPLKKLSDMKTGGIISRLTSDVNTTTGLLQLGLVSPGVSLIRLVIAIAMLVILNWKLALAAVAIIPVVMLLSLTVARKIRPIYRAVRDDAAYVDGRVGEAFSGIRVVRAFQREQQEELQYLVGNHGIIRKELFAHRRELVLWTTWGFLMASVGLVTVWFGGYLQIRGQATIGDIMAFQLYTMLLLNPVWQIVNSFSELQRALAAMERVFEVLSIDADMPDATDALEAPAQVDEIRFDRVDFEYHPGLPVLRDFDVTIPGGSTVALVGRSGAGKTTVTDLVARFHDPTSGQILVNGQNIRDFRLHSYRRLLAVVQQDTFLFDGTVADNIAYGRPEATFDEIVDAARRANADEFIQCLPQKYGSYIGERGVKLSGGQAQRLSIARAILANPRILILDEATSNLDSESEQLIQDSMRELLRGRTTFVIAHRLSTIAAADIILVMDDGQLVESGTHIELLQRQGLYFDMVHRQHRDLVNDISTPSPT